MVKKKNTKKRQKILLTLVLAILVPIVSFTLYNLYFADRIYPGIEIAGIGVGGKTPEQAGNLLKEHLPPQSKILLTNHSQNFEIELSSIDFSYDFVASAKAGYDFDRTGNIFIDFYQRLKAPLRRENLGLRLSLDEQKLESTLSVVAGQTATEPVFPSAKIVKSEVVVDKGKQGEDVDTKKLRVLIGQKLAYYDFSPLAIPIVISDPSLTDTEAESFRVRAENLIGKTLTINFEFQTFPYRGSDLLAFLAPKGGYNQEKTRDAVAVVAKDVEREPQNPNFVFSEGKVSEFAPAKDGIKLKKDELKDKIIEKLTQLEDTDLKEASFEIPVNRTAPEVQTADVNNLGIKELIGRGVSRFRHSIPSRIYNITLAASRMNGVLIKPGDTFSFNEALGDVSKFTGYKEAFIIKDGKTVLGDGGGVCQVSSTFFRAALNAGLPIVERRAHAYRVGYYEQDSPPGFDATVYSPTTDLKIKNDTPAYILVQTNVNTKTATLVFEFYGTKDGRVATTTKPIVSDTVAPPDDVYQDDPTLPSGQIKQIDFKAWGAKVVFNYKVERAGEVVYQKTFTSNYRPWQAVYLRGTGPSQ